MVPLDYLAVRLLRRLSPRRAMKLVLRWRLGAMPGLETRDPVAAANLYQASLAEIGLDLRGKRVMIFGYGGRLGLAVELLRRGARHVVLLDPYADPDRVRLSAGGGTQGYLLRAGRRVVVNPEYLSPLRAPLRSYLERGERLDVVFSWSVLEHVWDPEAEIQALAAVTPDGCQIHYVDLRDHVFQRPFEMLCHSQSVWSRWLDPASHLNRLRAWEYENLFRRSFPHVEMRVVEANVDAWRKIAGRVRPEFVGGDESLDAATRIRLMAGAALRPVEGLG